MCVKKSRKCRTILIHFVLLHTPTLVAIQPPPHRNPPCTYRKILPPYHSARLQHPDIFLALGDGLHDEVIPLEVEAARAIQVDLR